MLLHRFACLPLTGVLQYEGVVLKYPDVPRMEHEPQLLRALVELTNELLSSELDTSFYQHALEKTVQLVPAAEGGSVVIRHEDGFYHFQAAVGFDLSVLENIILTEEELDRPDTDVDVQEIDIHDFKRRVRERNAPYFDRAGRVEEIKSTLSVRLKTPYEIMGYFNLDNFSQPNAFTQADQTVAQAIASQVSIALHRLMLEKRLRREREHYQHLARHDPLTNLPNRRSLLDELTRTIASAGRRNSRIGLLYIDLDQFKSINDRFGHLVGDELVICVGERIRSAIRSGDFAARIGGDEFAVILSDITNCEDARRKADSIAEVICREVCCSTDGSSVLPGASIGTAVFPDEAKTVDELLSSADEDMYRLKRTKAGDRRT